MNLRYLWTFVFSSFYHLFVQYCVHFIDGFYEGFFLEGIFVNDILTPPFQQKNSFNEISRVN